ncbi:MAG: 3-deoxy-manno-octulosonate cytidylyltransferase, partial [Bacteroidia bacterium]|nr:3-deoxy-manno-octulosonate cytidylyltransferase [Bacteroidia bacterium]
MKFIGIIPARFESTRFPGKPLALLNGKPIIRWVYENVSLALEHVWVATDDDRIFNEVNNFGGNAVKTGSHHQSGTDRCAEAARLLSANTDFDIIVNVQGDEPFIQPEQINLLKSCFDEDTEIATLIKKIETPDELFNPNRPKVVIDNCQNALYFSRSPIPFVRGCNQDNWLENNTFWSHIGMYAYKASVLQKITKLTPGRLELIESLEQLRWLENGYSIKTAVTTHQSLGIDTPQDLQEAHI